MTAARNPQDWSLLLNEYAICKKKLESKREALRILLKQQEHTQVQNDVLNNKISQLQTELDGFKALLGNNWVQTDDGLHLHHREETTKLKTLNNLLQFSRQENQKIQNDFQNLKQLYNESQRDNQLLRTALSKHEVRKKVGINEKKGKELLISQLEEANAKVEELEEELQMLKDDKKELVEVRNSTQKKNTRLNTELNYVLHNDDKRIVDIDNLVLENKYLKEVIKQYKEEKAVALSTVSRYKEAMRQHGRTNKLSYLDLDESSTGNHQEGCFTKSFNQKIVSDLQRVNKLLTEKVSEKETALKHQRNTNRVLGTRVSELEKKLKTLEISGLWSHEQRKPRNLNKDDYKDSNNNADDNLLKVTDSISKEDVLSDDSPVHNTNAAPEGFLIDPINNISDCEVDIGNQPKLTNVSSDTTDSSVHNETTPKGVNKDPLSIANISNDIKLDLQRETLISDLISAN